MKSINWKKLIIPLTVLLAVTSGLLLYNSKPRISIITSVWKGDEFIEGFMEDITRQTIFPESELIVINANSPGDEERIIHKYLEKYKNIVYVKLDKDPGLYAVWNKAIKMAKSDYIMNANIDDRSKLDAIEIQLQEIEKNPSVDLVYAGYLITKNPNETFDSNHARWFCDPPEFSPKLMQQCLPGPRPIWRKSMHEKYGYFDESFTASGDLEMWVRAVDKGSIFKKISGFLTLFYANPEGISTKAEKSRLQFEENQRIIATYKHLWVAPK